jgi:Flp pilus assembly pilin Flp
MRSMMVDLIGLLEARVRTQLAGKEDGQALIEYALILGLIVTGAVATLELLGPSVVALLTQVENSFP